MTTDKNRARCLVVGYDAKAPSERALTWALRRAGRGGRVVVVHGVRSQGERLHVPARPSGQAQLARARATVELPFLERSDLYGSAQCDYEVRDDTPADALLRVAAEVDADEIVVCTRGGRRTRPRFDSVCSELLERSVVPLVVVP